MTVADAYAARIDAVEAQRARINGAPPPADVWSGPMARMFRADPHRQLDANLGVIASYIQPDDVLVDVGGGAGRIGLPLARRCREVINVEPSPGMGDEFESIAAEAGISNVRLVRAGWVEAPAVVGDVVLAAHVTYFVREIVPFIARIQAAARRRAMLFLASPPPPTRNSHLFARIFGEEQVFVPGQPELLPVLWEMGILPDVRLLPEPLDVAGGPAQTREEAVQGALRLVTLGMASARRAETQSAIEALFDELFESRPEGFRPLFATTLSGLLVTWETGKGA